MDYISTPRTLIYKHRDNLNDFGVQTQGTINNYLFSQMRKMTLLRTGDAKEIALQCFNNAYYICTLIQLEEFPDLCIDKYEQNLLEVKIPFPDDVCAASMALVCKLLPAYDAKWKQEDNFLISSIRYWVCHNRWIGNKASISFDNIFLTCNTDHFTILEREFSPRDIVEAIEEVGKENPSVLASGAEYICERLNCLDDARRRIYGADLAIAYLKDWLRDIYEDFGYNPKTNRFESEKHEPLIIADYHYEDEFWKVVNHIKEAIDYITKHYPKKEKQDSTDSNGDVKDSAQTAETELLQTTIKELKSKLTLIEKQLVEANNIKVQQATRINELVTENTRLTDENRELHERIENENCDTIDLDDIKRLAIDERIIFFSSALGVSLDPQYISQKRMAVLISKLSGNLPESIRTRLVALNREEKAVNEIKDQCYSQSTKDAANNVYKYIASVSKSYSVRTHAMTDIMKNIDILYGLNKEKRD